MTHPLLVPIGNWNPQLLREIRGRLRWRSVLATLAVVATIHIVILLAVWRSFLAGVESPWQSLFQAMMWLIAYGLYFAGGYSLVNDLTTEEQRGTLNFVRLSPRPSPTILLGKLLGVPLLYYLAIALFIPLHVLAGLLGGISWGLVVSFYVLLIAGGVFAFCLAILYALVSAAQSLVKTQPSTSSVSFAVITLIIFTPIFLSWNQAILWSHFSTLFPAAPNELPWFYFEVGLNPWIGHGFTLATLGIGTALVWSVIKRRLERPAATLMSKRQSYALVACLELLVVGFFIPGGEYASSFSEGPVFVLYGLNLVLFLVITFAVTPTRQALLDWRLYESQHTSLLSSLMWGERSPAPLAIAINLLIAAAVVVPCFLWAAIAGESLLPLIFVALGLSGQVLLYAVLSQRILASKVKNPFTWAIGTLALLLIVPPILLSILSQVVGSLATVLLWALWGFQAILLADSLSNQLSPAILIAAALIMLALQWSLVGLLAWHIQHFIRHMAGPRENPAIASAS